MPGGLKRVLCSFISQRAVTLSHNTNTSNTGFRNSYNMRTKHVVWYLNQVSCFCYNSQHGQDFMPRCSMQRLFRCMTLDSPYISHKEPFLISLLVPSLLRAIEKGHILLRGQSKDRMALQQSHRPGSFPSPRNA